MSLKTRAFLVGLFTFLFYQNTFCMFCDDFYSENASEDARIKACFEYMANPVLLKPVFVPTTRASAPTPMEIECGPDFVDCRKDACAASMRDINPSAAVGPLADNVVVEHDKDGDVIMKEKAKQNKSVLLAQYRQRKLLNWIASYTSKGASAVKKDRLINWLSGKWGLVKKFGLRDWFLAQLFRQPENREDLLVVWSVFVLK